MRCRKCPQRAVLGLPRHNIALCGPCLTEFVRTQVQRAISSQGMFGPESRILVAVSGGKDSLTLWEILLKLGYKADALYIDLGIAGYSERSQEKVLQFAQNMGQPCGARLRIHRVTEEMGTGVKDLAVMMKRPTCSTCGTVKRYQFNRVAWENDYDVMATGHNLDDEAARLLGNVLQWQDEYLQKQAPSLPPSIEGFAKKVKPLYRLTEREIAAYAVVNKIDYLFEECPMAKGAKMLIYKEVLNRLEGESPGTKQRFYWGFLEKLKKDSNDHGLTMTKIDQTALTPCQSCGQPTTAETCSYCRLLSKVQTPPTQIQRIPN